jgi:integral membrane sensor domain MASE1
LIVLGLGELAANGLYYASTANTPEHLALAAMISGNVLTAYFGARLWHALHGRWRNHLGDFFEPVCCTVVAFAAPLIAATIGAVVLVISGAELPARAPGVWVAWWTSNAIGALFVLPLLLSLPALRDRVRHAGAGDVLRGALLFGLSAGTVAVVYGLPANAPYHFALFPLLILATVWFDAPGTRLLAFLLAAGGLAAAALGRGPFATGQSSADLVSAELFLAAGGLIALLLPAIQNRRNLLRPLPLGLLLGGWLASGLLVADLIKQHRRGDVADFAQLAANAEAVIENRMVNYLAVLRSARSFVLGVPTVTSAYWRDFVQSLNLPTEYPGLRGVGLVYPVPPEELESFLARVRADAFTLFMAVPTVYSMLLDAFDKQAPAAQAAHADAPAASANAPCCRRWRPSR